MRPIAKNVILEIQESSDTYGGGLIKPESHRGIAGDFKFVDCAYDCCWETKLIPKGAEVLVDYDTEDVEKNIIEREGRKLFIVRENFVMAYFVPTELTVI